MPGLNWILTVINTKVVYNRNHHFDKFRVPQLPKNDSCVVVLYDDGSIIICECQNEVDTRHTVSDLPVSAQELPTSRKE